jgi:hypothetical protein
MRNGGNDFPQISRKSTIVMLHRSLESFKIYFINVFVAKLGSTAGKFLIWKERGGRGEREKERERERKRE